MRRLLLCVLMFPMLGTARAVPVRVTRSLPAEYCQVVAPVLVDGRPVYPGGRYCVPCPFCR